MPWRRDKLLTPIFLGFPRGSGGKESTRNAGELGWIPGVGRSPGQGDGYPLQNSGLENSMELNTRLSDFHFHFQIRHLCVCVFLLFSFLIFIIVQ